jgi:hypothetical protein
MKLHQFTTSEVPCGREFLAPSWATWRAIARLIDGDAHLLSPVEQALVLKLTGRTKLPESAPRELYIGAGRRSGKSRFGSVVAVWLASQECPQLAAGETELANVTADTISFNHCTQLCRRAAKRSIAPLSADSSGRPAAWA